MIESEAHQLSEEQMLEAVVLGQKCYKVAVDAIIELAKKAAKDPWKIPDQDDEIKNLPSKIRNEFKENFFTAYKIQEKQKRN